VLWGGGVYNWFDPLTLIRAVDRVRHDVPNIRCYFLGMKHPNPDVPEMRMAQSLRTLSDELGLTGSHVFFNEAWVSYDDRANYLLDADIGVSCHFPGIETEFSFRTRILDYLWSGLPIISTDGDAFAGLVRSEGLGRVVPPEDPDALADALRALTDAEARRAAAANVRRVAPEFTWPTVLAPITAVCADPRRAADAQRVAASGVESASRSRAAAVAPVSTFVRHVRQGGLRHALRKVYSRLRALLQSSR
jgi:glycosyltransferase involved in cell wall biosynthesis